MGPYISPGIRVDYNTNNFIRNILLEEFINTVKTIHSSDGCFNIELLDKVPQQRHKLQGIHPCIRQYLMSKKGTLGRNSKNAGL